MLSGEMKPGRGCRIPRVPGEFARSKEGGKPHADGSPDVDAIEVEWDEGKKLEKDVFGKREPEPMFSFSIEPPRALDDEVDAWVIENVGRQAVTGVVRAQCRDVAFKRRGPDRGSKEGNPVRDRHNGGREGGVISAAAKRFVGSPDRGISFVGGWRERVVK